MNTCDLLDRRLLMAQVSIFRGRSLESLSDVCLLKSLTTHVLVVRAHTTGVLAQQGPSRTRPRSAVKRTVFWGGSLESWHELQQLQRSTGVRMGQGG